MTSDDFDDDDAPLIKEIATEPDVLPTDTTDEDAEEETVAPNVPAPETVDIPAPSTLFDETEIDFRGESLPSLQALMKAYGEEVGIANLDTQVQTTGSWANIIYRAIAGATAEEHRIQEAIEAFTNDERASLNSVYKKDGVVLKTRQLGSGKTKAGTTTTLSGNDALMAFEYRRSKSQGGGYKLPLYNSGISIDLITPTGNDLQTMLFNCGAVDRELGTSSGAHYFAYSDTVYKTQILNFIMPLITDSSYIDWKKTGMLASVIKLPDLAAIIMTIAHMCYKNGFDNFRAKCTRPYDTAHPTGCHHTETLTVNLSKMILTRFSTLSEKAINHMTTVMMSNTKHTLSQIAEYQSELGFEGEKITFDDLTFTMRIPSLSEHIDAGNQFIGDIINEIEGDNTDARYEQFGYRYIRTFLPWIASVEIKDDQPEPGVIKTTDAKVITRQLERLDYHYTESNVAETFRRFVNKAQLTYVGYPATQCPACGYRADTPSGLITIDPFSNFFILASRYLISLQSSQKKA
jgi:hypothetical protein